MDSMDLERERGITIQSAATHCTWKDYHINIIDTPRPRRLHHRGRARAAGARRRHPGALLRWPAFNRSRSPSTARCGATECPASRSSTSVTALAPILFARRDQLREKLNLNPVLLQLPIGLEDKFEGVVDLVTMRSIPLRRRRTAKTIRESDIPADMADDAQKAREEMLDALSMFCDDLTEAMLDDKVGTDVIRAAIRKATHRSPNRPRS